MLTADVVAYPTQFWHPVQNLAPGWRVAVIASIGPERALLWRHRLSDVVAERRGARGVALAERVDRGRVANGELSQARSHARWRRW